MDLNSIYRSIIFNKFRFSPFFSKLQSVIIFNERERMMQKAIEFIKDSGLGNGGYFEFGVFFGRSFVSAYHFANQRGLNMDFYAFDSFQGLPQLKGMDINDGQFYERQYSCDETTFKKILLKNGINMSKVKIVKGFFNESLNNELKKKQDFKVASIIHIDSDLYESAFSALNFITDYIQDGTIIIFDDWFCFKGNPNKGEQKAFREWLENHNDFRAIEFQKFGWHGNSFIIHKMRKELKIDKKIENNDENKERYIG